MECSPRGSGNRLAECLEYATGVKLVENAVHAALGMPTVGVEQKPYDGCWAEVILHSNQPGVFASLWIDASLEGEVFERDLWIKPGKAVCGFSAANEVIGTLVLSLQRKNGCRRSWRSPPATSKCFCGIEEMKMRELGGYIELDTYRLPMLHEGAIALNFGRNALAYLLKSRGFKRLWISRFICDSVTGVCKREGVPYSLCSIGFGFLPAQEIELGEGEWLYFVNYYSRFTNEQILEYVRTHKRVIVDNAQSYSQEPIPGVDTLYTCR